MTAGNSSGINDGAAALLLVASAQAARGWAWQPLARVVACASAGVAPDVMGLGPIPATRKALARAGLTVGQLDLVEINEAFAAQAIACMRELELDPAKHQRQRRRDRARPSARRQRRAHRWRRCLHEMRRRDGRYGLATMCIGVGQGIATVFERAELKAAT